MQAIHQKEFPAGVKTQHHRQYLPLRRHEVRGAEQWMLLLVLAQRIHQRNGSKGVSPPTSLQRIWGAGSRLLMAQDVPTIVQAILDALPSRTPAPV